MSSPEENSDSTIITIDDNETKEEINGITDSAKKMLDEEDNINSAISKIPDEEKLTIEAFRIDDDIDQLEKNKDQLEKNKEILSVKISNFKSNMSHNLDSFNNMVKRMAQKSGKIIEENGGMGVVVIESNKMLDNFSNSNSKSVFSPTLSNIIIKTIRPIIKYMKSNINSIIISQNKSVIPMLEKLCSNLDNNLEKSESRYEKIIKYASKMKKSYGYLISKIFLIEMVGKGLNPTSY